MIYNENLEKEVLEKHFKNNADELIFLGGFIGPEPVSELSETLNKPLTCKIIYGCYKAKGIDPLIHKKYQTIPKRQNYFGLFKQASISYGYG